MNLARVAQRLLSATVTIVAAALSTSCASPGMPPGGPPDPERPKLLRVTPDTNAVNVRADEVLFFFDEVIAERPGNPAAAAPAGGATQGGRGQSGGAGGLAGGMGGMGGMGGGFSGGMGGGMGGSGSGDLSAIVSVSPTDGRDIVTWRRTAIEVRPRRGFRPNTAYRVTLYPGVQDLRGNVIGERVDLVFSTGPTIPTGEMVGAVFDYAAAKPAPGARVEVFTSADTTLRWVARTDSSGRFIVRDLNPGTYRLRAWIDQNNDRQLGEREAYDSSTVTVETRASKDLYAFIQDTMPPRMDQVELIDSTAIRIKFDRPIAADWQPTETSVLLVNSDSTAIAFGGLLMPSVVYDSLAKAARAAAAKDSTASDTLARDSARIEMPRLAVGAAGAARNGAPAAARDSIEAAPSDTTPVIPPPKFERVAPIAQWTIRLAAPLPPGLYKLKVIGAPGLNGARSNAERDVRVRPPAAAAP